MEWLDAQPLKGKTLIDYGCGSGILGIAGLLLGAEQALGIDNDPQALIASKDNASRNQVAERFELASPENNPQTKADFIVANILAGPLMMLSEAIVSQLKPGGQLALSGVLSTQAEEVSTHYQNLIKITKVSQKGDWVRIEGTKAI